MIRISRGLNGYGSGGRGVDTATGLATFEYDGETYDVEAATLMLRVDPGVSGELQWRSTRLEPDGSLDLGVQGSVNIHLGQRTLADLGSGMRVTLGAAGEDGGLLTLHVRGAESRLQLRWVELAVDPPQDAAEVVVGVEGSAPGDEVTARYHGELPMTCMVEGDDGISWADATSRAPSVRRCWTTPASERSSTHGATESVGPRLTSTDVGIDAPRSTRVMEACSMSTAIRATRPASVSHDGTIWHELA